MKKPALLSLIRIPPLCAIQRCTSGTGPLATNCQRACSRFGEDSASPSMLCEGALSSTPYPWRPEPLPGSDRRSRWRDGCPRAGRPSHSPDRSRSAGDARGSVRSTR